MNQTRSVLPRAPATRLVLPTAVHAATPHPGLAPAATTAAVTTAVAAPFQTTAVISPAAVGAAAAPVAPCRGQPTAGLVPARGRINPDRSGGRFLFRPGGTHGTANYHGSRNLSRLTSCVAIHGACHPVAAAAITGAPRGEAGPTGAQTTRGSSPSACCLPDRAAAAHTRPARCTAHHRRMGSRNLRAGAARGPAALAATSSGSADGQESGGGHGRSSGSDDGDGGEETPGRRSSSSRGRGGSGKRPARARSAADGGGTAGAAPDVAEAAATEESGSSSGSSSGGSSATGGSSSSTARRRRRRSVDALGSPEAAQPTTAEADAAEIAAASARGKATKATRGGRKRSAAPPLPDASSAAPSPAAFSSASSDGESGSSGRVTGATARKASGLGDTEQAGTDATRDEPGPSVRGARGIADVESGRGPGSGGEVAEAMERPGGRVRRRRAPSEPMSTAVRQLRPVAAEELPAASAAAVIVVATVAGVGVEAAVVRRRAAAVRAH